tara:strand:+ start:4117 stop:4998 length:882 start_codon:yes stop_codon:yes gene_type:complete
MNEATLPNLVWLGAYKTDTFTNKGIPSVPLASMESEERKSLEKQFQTNIRILERKPTANGTLKVVVEFIELGGNYPPKHNLASMESYFPTPEEFPHHVGDTFRAEITRKYLKADMDTNRENVVGIKTGEYDNHFVYSVKWDSWQFVDGQPHSQNNGNTQAELKVVDTPQESFKDKDVVNKSSQDLVKKQVVKVQDERQADRDARNVNSSDAIAGNIITELWKAGRFPQMEAYTDIIHIGMQVNILSRTIQGEQVDELSDVYNHFLDGRGVANNLDQELNKNGGTRNADGSTNI